MGHDICITKIVMVGLALLVEASADKVAVFTCDLEEDRGRDTNHVG